ncbi:MAG: hypothetical protein ISN64_01230 [Rickettsia sp.]|nr:hypothetical protein [Rickettsia sp.]
MLFFRIFFTNFSRSYNYAFFTLSALKISEYFFPGANNEEKFLNFFILYPIIFLGKPLGSIIFGIIADKFGNIYMIRFTSILSVFSIFLLIFIPSYSDIGYIASICAFLSRVIFISTTSVETDALRLLLVKNFQDKILANGVSSFFSQFAVLVASIIYKYGIFSSWKIGFVIGALLSLISIIIQMKDIKNSKDIKTAKKIDIRFSYFKKIFLQNYKMIFIFAIIHGIIGGLYHFAIIFFSNFLVLRDILDKASASNVSIYMVFCYMFFCLLSGVFSFKNKEKSRKQILFCISFAIILLIVQSVIWNHLDKFSYLFAIILQMAFISVIPFFSLPILYFLQNLLSTNMLPLPLTLYSISHSLGSLFISSNTIWVIFYIWKKTNSYINITLFIIILLILMILAFNILSKLIVKKG